MNLWLCLFLLAAPDLDTPDIGALAEDHLHGIEGIHLELGSKGEKARLKGEVLTPADYERIHSFLQKYPQVENETQLDRETMELYREHLRHTYPQLRFQIRGEKLLVAGAISKTDWAAIKKIYPPIEKIKVRREPKIAPTVFLELLFVEIKTNALERLGLRLSSPIGITAYTQIQNTSSQFYATSDPLRAFLDSAIQSGEARIHAKQSLVTQDRHVAEFKAGGEFPIRVVGENVAKILFKDFGLRLKFRPKIINKTRIHLHLNAEISEIDMGSSVEGLPVILQKKLQTQIFGRINEMAAIGGLVRTAESAFADEIPGLSKVPLLGSLFRSQDFKKHRSEAYLFVTPQVLKKPWQPGRSEP